MQLVLRIAAYLTFLLGIGLLGRLLGMYSLSGMVDMLHMLLGIATAILALVVLGNTIRQDGIRGIAAWFPLLPLALGILWYTSMNGVMALIAIHAVLGLTAIGLIEMHLARRKRAQRAALGQQ